MDYRSSPQIISQYRPIRGEVSKQILWAILHDLPIPSDILPKNVSAQEIENLREKYKEKLKFFEYEGIDSYPRNKIFYALIRDKINSFTWKIQDFGNKKGWVSLNSPRVNRLEPSLLFLLLNDVDDSTSSLLHRKYSCIEKLPNNLIIHLSNLFEKIQVIYPDKQNMTAIVDWLSEGIKGKHLHLFSLVCPDYSVEPTGNSLQPFRHTFDSLGSGMGLIAKRIIDVTPVIKEILGKFGIQLTSIIAMADYEVLSEANLARVKLSYDEFLKRIESSRDIIQKNANFPVKTLMMTDLYGGHEAWRSAHTLFRNKFDKNDFGCSALNLTKLINIIKTRKQLYNSWFGHQTTLMGHMPILLSQGAEYAAVGDIINKTYANCLILGADHSALAPFYCINEFIPSLYLKRHYC